jgi:restriction endonuclease S subunit
LKSTLNNLASIHTGIFAKPIALGEIVYLQSKHFDENGSLKHSLQPDLKANAVNVKHILRNGDVLFAAKGTKNFAAWYESNNQPAVASTSFFVIRLKDNYRNKILPQFLAWLINHPITQTFLKGKAIGTSMASISKAVLQDLEISIPDLQTQKIILKIANLRSKEKRLKQQIDMLRESQIQQQIVISLKS